MRCWKCSYMSSIGLNNIAPSIRKLPVLAYEEQRHTVLS